MAESVGLSVLIEVAKPMVQVVMGRVTEEMRSTSMVGFRRELTKLEKKMRIIQGIVDSMGAVPNAAVEEWLRDTIRIIRDAENMMDVLAYENTRSVVMKRKRLLNNNKALFSSANMKRLVILPLKRVYLRTKMGRWIRKINSDIEEAKKEARFIKDLRGLDLERSASQRPAASNTVNNDDEHQTLQQVRRYVDTSLFLGRDSDVESLVNMLTKPPSPNSNVQISSKRLSVIAIVGIGGLGKTTLAKSIYMNDVVSSHFTERFWISELKTFDIKKILNEMMKFLELGYEDIIEIAIRKLQKHLGGKRYLLVLDDVWNTRQDLWDSMRNALENIGGSKDSMVLTTTRSANVAVTMHAYSVHNLSGLSEDDSWSLFKQIAFSERLEGETLALEAIGKKIVEKCKGVPLAIKSIAGILHKKRNLRDWKNIEQSEVWDDIQDHEILPSLKLSYNHLSPMLKKCFSLCATMPKGWWFQNYELICRWMALGLIQNSSNGNITMEDVGEEYLDELLSISFLLVKERNELGEATGYLLHDLVYDLARSVSKHEQLHLEATKKENKVIDIQHLIISTHTEITLDLPDKMTLENIRLLDITYKLPAGLLVQVKYLRVLYIGHSTLEVVPESIATLKCLKFLDLEDNPIKVLPNSIMELYNLQSLFLYKCKPLSKIPRGLSNLVNLRHLGLSFHLCPTEEGVIKELSQLQTVPPLQLSEGGFKISELGYLRHMKGSLDIKGLELIKSKLDAEKSALSMKPKVDQLRLSWDSDDDFIKHEEVLDGLCPSQYLKVLSIKGYGGEKFPSWLMKMNVPEDHNNENVVPQPNVYT